MRASAPARLPEALATAMWPRGDAVVPPAGAGPFTHAVVHGFALSPAMWTPALVHAGLGGRALRLRLPGHGPGRRAPPGAPGFAAVAAHAVACLAARAGRPVHLVGHSMGARLALAMAVLHPAWVASLTLVGVQPGLGGKEARRARAAEEAGWRRRLAAVGVRAFAREWARLPVFAGERDLPAPRRARLAAWRRAHTAAGLASALDALGLGGMPDFWPALPRLPMAVAAVAGARDARYLALAKQTADAVGRRGRWVAVPGAAHNPAWERPRAFAALLAAPDAVG